MSPTRTLPAEFILKLRRLEESYLAEQDPIRQSGFGGGPERWQQERALILDAVTTNGDFLDIGCANGYLLECLANWAREKDVNLVPYGLDQGTKLIDVARSRYPDLAAHFWAGNAWTWSPPRRFRYVYTLDDCVPEDFLAEYIQRLLKDYLARPGTLIVGTYGSRSESRPARDTGALLTELGFTVAGSSSAGTLPETRIAWLLTHQIPEP